MNDVLGTGFEDMTQKPTTTQMIRLAANTEFRAAMQRVVTEMKNAGVDSAVRASCLATNTELI
jgi:hypothetical protein